MSVVALEFLSERLAYGRPVVWIAGPPSLPGRDNTRALANNVDSNNGFLFDYYFMILTITICYTRNFKHNNLAISCFGIREHALQQSSTPACRGVLAGWCYMSALGTRCPHLLDAV